MKKIIAIALALVMVLALAACATTPAQPTKPSTTNPTQPTNKPTEPTNKPTEPTEPVITQTSWNSVADYNKESSDTGAWRYFFFDPTDSSYNPMGGYEERNGGSLCEWYPWEGSWVGVGFNGDVADKLEVNNEGKDGMRAVLGFCAPADGKYVFSGVLANPWGQTFGTFTISVNGEAKLSLDINSKTEATYHIDGVEIEMKAGEIAYIECTSTNDWVSAYVNIDVELDGESVSFEVPSAGAVADFNKESADGTWIYAATTDGTSYTVNTSFNAPTDWDGDPDVDAEQWYSADGTGIGFNYDVPTMLEVNVNDNNGEMAALGYKASVAGTYTFTVYTMNKWNQNGSVVAHLDGHDDITIPFLACVTEATVEFNMNAGEVIYFHGITNGGWVSAYMSVSVSVVEKEIVVAPENAGAVAEFSKENANGTWVYASTADGKEYVVCPKFDAPDWNEDGAPDAEQWYSANGTGIGKNFTVTEFLEANVPDAGQEMMALGYKAAADGTVKLTVYTQNKWNQNGGDVVVSFNGNDIEKVPFIGDVSAKTVTVEMKAGEIVYVHGTSNGGWVSCYLNVVVG